MKSRITLITRINKKNGDNPVGGGRQEREIEIVCHGGSVGVSSWRNGITGGGGMDCLWGMEKIKQVLPHRYPFFFIDKVIEVDTQKGRVVCLKNVTFNECFFEGHFPGHPVMPGVFVLEALSQAGIILFAVLKPQIVKEYPDYYLGKVEAKFLKPVRPGDRLVLEVHKEKVINTGGIIKAYARVEEEAVARANIAFGVNIEAHGA